METMHRYQEMKLSKAKSTNDAQIDINTSSGTVKTQSPRRQSTVAKFEITF